MHKVAAWQLACEKIRADQIRSPQNCHYLLKNGGGTRYKVTDILLCITESTKYVWVAGLKISLGGVDTSSADPTVVDESQLAWIDGSPMLPFSPGTPIAAFQNRICFVLSDNTGNLLGKWCDDDRAVLCEVDCRPGMYIGWGKITSKMTLG